MLVLRFRCQCGEILAAKHELFGQRQSCPKCEHSDVVPIPSALILKKWVGALKVPLPGSSSVEYILELEKLLVTSQQLFGFVTHAYDSKLVKELIREITDRLQLYKGFLEEVHQDASHTAQQAALSIANGLASVAAGYNFGSIGVRNERLESFQPYLPKQLDFHSHAQLAQDEVLRLRDLAAQI